MEDPYWPNNEEVEAILLQMIQTSRQWKRGNSLVFEDKFRTMVPKLFQKTSLPQFPSPDQAGKESKEIPQDKLTSSDYPVQLEPVLKTGIDELGHTSMAIMALEAPYKVPFDLDLNRLTSLLKAHMSAMEDHIWYLREDPEYFRVEMLEKMDHSYESVPDEKGKPHPLAHKIMTRLYRQARKLAELQREYKDEIKLTEELPHEYKEALFCFLYCLRQATNDAIKMFTVEFECSYPLKKWCYYRFTWPFEEDGCSVYDGRPRSFYTEDQNSLLYLKEMLGLDEESWIRQSTMIDELERLLKTTPEEHEKRLKPLRDFGTIIRGGRIPVAPLGRIANPTGGKFKYPYEKRRTKDTVHALRQAEANLDIVWAELERLKEANVTQFRDLALYRLLSQPRSLRMTAEWVEPEQSNKKGQPSTDYDLWFLNRPLSNLFLGESEQPTQKIDKTTKKMKAKTKGEPSKTQNGDTRTVEVPEPETVDQQPTFAVDARALKVFRTLFFNPDVTSTPGEIAWNDFLHAMGSTGFQMEKLYGSVWNFQPTELDVERGIHFHEPHQKGKIDFQIARRHGRRLARTYGWHGEIFTLKKK
ncbi:hypothetical protein EDB82DRAFT_476264 [Fusarium venenatum]|uniref:uncharacterized protein n=1 Tax=Fusarium venenatum TaxID=56646 RepID=UPI001DBB0EAA|nr:hypothetical protein EDB82DRAFT_476264 [Fusarium venenatum]